VGRDGAVVKVIWVKEENKYFCKGGWTAKSATRPSGKSGRTEANPLDCPLRSFHRDYPRELELREPISWRN
jgi:hypothetical protein